MTDLTLDQAQAILDAARRKAEGMDIRQNIADVDAGADPAVPSALFRFDPAA